MIAREAGLEPLADKLFADPTLTPLAEAAKPSSGTLADGGFADASAVLDGVRDILSETLGRDAALVGPHARMAVGRTACSRASWSKARTSTNTDVSQVPRLLRLRRADPHRAVAPCTGGVPRPHAGMCWTRSWQLDEEQPVPGQPSMAEGRIAAHLVAGAMRKRRAADELVRKTVAWTWKVKLSPEPGARPLHPPARRRRGRWPSRSSPTTCATCCLAAPAGKRVVMGLDPGIRTGVKVAVVSDTGKVLDTTPSTRTSRASDWEGSLHTLGRLVATHGVNLIAIGNGTASRETDKLAADLIKRVEASCRRQAIDKVVVSEAGASVYSASEFASKELPELDVSLRGAVSIARRLQDPLAELVKIDPKSIGVGQYQHDVNQSGLARSLDAVVEDCVNACRRGPEHRHRRRCWRVSGLSPAVAAEHRALARFERRPSSNAPAAAGRQRAWGRAPSNRQQASCASAGARTRWT